MPHPAQLLMLPSVPRRSVADVILADSPLAYWRCNEAAAASTLVDGSGNGHTLTLAGSTTTGIAAKNSRLLRAATFSTTGYGTVADSAPFRLLGDMTFECWIRLAATLTSGQIARLGICGASGETEAANYVWLYELRNSGGTQQIRCFHENGAGVDNDQAVNLTYTATAWNHLAVTRDAAANAYEVFLNGASVGSVGYSDDPTGGSTTTFNLGRNSGTGAISDRARDLDEVAVFSTRLSARRIFEHYRAGRRS